MAVLAMSMLVLLVAVGVNGQTVAGPGQPCRTGGNILPITCSDGLSCVSNTTSSGNPDVATQGTCQVANATVPSNATLAIYQAVKFENDQLVTALLSGNFLAVTNFVTTDVQLILPNITSPLTFLNLTTLLTFATQLSGIPSVNNVPVTRFFKVIDANNAIVVQQLIAGRLGPIFVTSLWRYELDYWVLAFTDIAPANNGTITNATAPLFQTTTTANVTANATLNATVGNSTTVQRAVVAASNGLLAAIANATLNVTNVNQTVAILTNATSRYLAPGAQVVIAMVPSPSPLNVSNPQVLTLVQQLRNTSLALSNQTFVAYQQLNPVAVLLTSEVYNSISNIYLTQLWEYLPSINTTTTGINSTSPANATNATASSWQLSFASLNVAPPGLAPNAIRLS